MTATPPGHPAPESDAGLDWHALAGAVRDRRFDLDLSQESLVERRGPSHQIVRNIEKGLPADYRDTTFRKLDRALDWPDGTARRILDGHPAPEGDAGLDWPALGTEVRRRRALMHLRQADLEARGGPGAGTVRNIEQASRASYAHRTFVQLETALDWPGGVVESILRGTATRAEIDDVVTRGLERVDLDRGTADVQGIDVGSDDARALRVGRLVIELWRELSVTPKSDVRSRTPPAPTCREIAESRP